MSYIIKIRADVHNSGFIQQILIDEIKRYQLRTSRSLDTSKKNNDKPVQILKEYDGMLQAGNTLGFGITDGGILVITVDGKEVETFVIDDGLSSKIFFPFIRSVANSCLNMGHQKFKFDQANKEEYVISMIGSDSLESSAVVESNDSSPIIYNWQESAIECLSNESLDDTSQMDLNDKDLIYSECNEESSFYSDAQCE